ncbi:MAG: nitrilase-related carbon-nitrogen hydrolase, partial [Trebonia sp.]
MTNPPVQDAEKSRALTRVAAVSFEPQIGDLRGNRSVILDTVSAAVAAGAGLVVLPELSTSGYVFSGPDEAAALAIDVGDDLFSELSAAATLGAVIVVGFCETDGGRLFNSAAVLDGAGILGVYRKTHLWDREKLVFEAGHAPPPVLDTRVGRVGVLVCYDLEFPEMTRSLALRGVEVIAVPANWPLLQRPSGEHPPEVIQAMAAARTNQVFIVCA